MNKKEFNFMLNEGEGLSIEFKESFNSAISKEIVAFANSSGGRIFLGVDDKGKINGIKITNKLKSQIESIARNCDPSIKIGLEDIEGQRVLVIKIDEGKNKPYSCKEGFYLRIGANSQKMKRDEIIDFIINEGKMSFDEMPSKIKDYSVELVSNYIKRFNVEEDITKDILINLGVCDLDGNLNNAGILFFTEKPKKYLINAYVTCARYKGMDKLNVLDRKDFEGDLISQVENSMDFIKRNTKLSYKIENLEREEIPEYPVKAIREALLNAIMHRDYFSRGGNVQIDIYDDRLILTNVGGLMKPLTKENFGKIAVRRNPLIADLFHRINFIERMGTGIKRIKDSCNEHGGVEFSFDVNGYFISKFNLKKGPAKNQPKTSQKPAKDERKKLIFEAIKDKRFTNRFFAREINVNRSTVESDLNELKDEGIIEFVGSTSGGYWRIK